MARLSIKLFGRVPPCPRCRLAERMITKAIPRLGVEVDFSRHNILDEQARAYGIMMTPAIVVNDRKLWEGSFPTTKEFIRVIGEQGNRPEGG